MRYQYVVILKKHSQRATDFLSFLLCLFSSLCFFYAQISNRRLNYFLFGAAILILSGLILNSVGQRKNRGPVRYRYLLLVAALGWIAMPFLPWLGLLFVGLAFLEYQTKRPLEIGFDQDHIMINTLIRQRFAWSDFNNVILKDGLLTLDFRSNRLLQKEVADDEDDDDADEEEFNAYCRHQLAAAHPPDTF